MTTWFFSDTVYVTTDPSVMDKDIVFDYLHNTAYWSKGIPKDICMTSLENSVPFSVVDQQKFVGFGRLVTDYSTFAYLGDVFILKGSRGKGYGKFLVDCVNSWIEDHYIRTALLLTRDAQELYKNKKWVHPDTISSVMRYKSKNPDFYRDLHHENEV